MKKVDFTLHNNLDETQFEGVLRNEIEKPAIIKQTFVRPIDFVGKLRLPRLKLTSGVLPLMLIKPSSKTYSTAEHDAITTLSLTPTEIIYGFLWHKEDTAGATPIIPGNGNVYSFTVSDSSATAITPCLPNAYPSLINKVNANTIIYAHLYINEAPHWQQQSATSWKLINSPRILHDWSELSTNSENFMLYVRADAAYNWSLSTVSFSDNSLRFSINVVKEATEEYYTTPVFFCTHQLARFVAPLDILNPFRFTEQILNRINDTGLTRSVTFYTPTSNYIFSPQFQSFISSSSVPAGITSLDFSCTAILPINRLRDQINPYQSLIITSDELNYNGESLTVNTLDVNGVISPSSLAILKSYVIGTDEEGRSDFVFYDDHLSQTPALINNPRLSQLTLRFFVLTKENQIIPLTVPPGQAIFVQLAIEP